MIEYTYLVGSAQSKQSDNQEPSVTVTYNNHHVGNVRIPSKIPYQHTHAQFTHKHTNKHTNSQITDPN